MIDTALFCRGINHYKTLYLPSIKSPTIWGESWGVCKLLQSETTINVIKAVEVSSKASIVSLIAHCEYAKYALVLSEKAPVIDENTRLTISKAGLNVLWVNSAMINSKNVNQCVKSWVVPFNEHSITVTKWIYHNKHGFVVDEF